MNTNGNKTDVDGFGCDWYVTFNSCGKYDDEDFKSQEMCCMCGGGENQVGHYCRIWYFGAIYNSLMDVANYLYVTELATLNFLFTVRNSVLKGYSANNTEISTSFKQKQGMNIGMT